MRFCTADFGEQAGSPFFFFLFSVVCLLRDLHPAVKGSVLGCRWGRSREPGGGC